MDIRRYCGYSTIDDQQSQLIKDWNPSKRIQSETPFTDGIEIFQDDNEYLATSPSNDKSMSPGMRHSMGPSMRTSLRADIVDKENIALL